MLVALRALYTLARINQDGSLGTTVAEVELQPTTIKENNKLIIRIIIESAQSSDDYRL